MTFFFAFQFLEGGPGPLGPPPGHAHVSCMPILSHSAITERIQWEYYIHGMHAVPPQKICIYVRGGGGGARRVSRMTFFCFSISRGGGPGPSPGHAPGCRQATLNKRIPIYSIQAARVQKFIGGGGQNLKAFIIDFPREGYVYSFTPPPLRALMSLRKIHLFGRD